MEAIIKYTVYFMQWDPKTRFISLLLPHGLIPDFGLTIGYWLISRLAWNEIFYLINLGKQF